MQTARPQTAEGGAPRPFAFVLPPMNAALRVSTASELDEGRYIAGLLLDGGTDIRTATAQCAELRDAERQATAAIQ